MAKPKQSPTNELTERIIGHLFRHGVFAWREDANPVPVVRAGVFSGFRPPRKTGKPDIIAILPPRARFLGLELKVGKDRLRPEQIGFHATVAKMGGQVLVVKTWEDYLTQITPILQDIHRFEDENFVKI